MDSKLQQMIEDFLAEHRESDGGYAPVTDSDMDQLDAIIQVLASAKCEEDPDGDIPIEWKLVNRRVHQRLAFRPIPYYDFQIDDDMTEEQRLDVKMEIHHATTLNFAFAMDDLERYHKHIERVLKSQRKKLK